MTAVYKKELKTYFTGMTGAIFIGFLLLITGIFMTVYNLRGLYPNFEYALSGVSFIYLFAVPVLTMRSVAEEKHSRTDQLLYSLPMSVSEIVMAKYAAMLTVLGIPCAVMAFYPLILTSFGNVRLAPAYSTLLAFFLLGGALIAIGMFISSLTESQVIAAVITLGVMVLLNFMSGIATLVPSSAGVSLVFTLVLCAVAGIVIHVLIKNAVITAASAAVLAGVSVLVYLIDSSLYEGFIPTLLSKIALFDHLTTFQNGIFDLTSIILYISAAVLFVYLTVQSMEKKRWN